MRPLRGYAHYPKNPKKTIEKKNRSKGKMCPPNKVFMMQIFGCADTMFPIKYLGISLKTWRLTRQDWTSILESLETKLKGWIKKLLSEGGKITLLNLVLTTTPLYHMSFFVLPRWVREIIDRVRS